MPKILQNNTMHNTLTITFACQSSELDNTGICLRLIKVEMPSIKMLTSNKEVHV